MKIITAEQARERGILTKRDLEDIVKALRGTLAQRLSNARRNELADKLQVSLDRAFGAKR